MNESSAFARALRLAALSTESQKHGAIVYLRKGAIGVGINVGFGHPHKHAWSRHAEIAAILASQRSRDSLKGCTLVSARITKGGSPGISKPCDACWAAMLVAGIERVVYHDGQRVVSKRVTRA